MRWLLRLFRHRHRYNRLIPGAVQDPLAGGIFPCWKMLCRCGEEDPYGKKLRDIIRMKAL